MLKNVFFGKTVIERFFFFYLHQKYVESTHFLTFPLVKVCAKYIYQKSVLKICDFFNIVKRIVCKNVQPRTVHKKYYIYGLKIVFLK